MSLITTPESSVLNKNARLFKLEEVGTTRSWDYVQPTLQIPGRYTHRSPMTNESFAEAFFLEFPAFKGMDWSNVVLRGGAIIDLLLHRPVHDLDFYFYGFQAGDDTAILRRAEAFLTFLLEVERKFVESFNQTQQKKKEDRMGHHYPSGVSGFFPGDPGHVRRIDIKGVRRGAVITVKLSAIKAPLQLVLIRYPTKEMMTSTSDIAATGAIFDGQDVWLSQEAKWELENMTIRVEKGRYPHPSRIKKYFNKGFDICLPELDVSKIPRAYIDFGWNLVDAVRTPSLGFTYSAVEDKRITVQSFFDIADNSSSSALSTGRYGGRHHSSSHRRHGEGSGFDSKSVLYGNILVLANLCQKAVPTTTSATTSSISPEEDGRAAKKSRILAPGNKKEDNEGLSFSVYAEADFIKDVLKPWPDLTSRQVENTYLGITNEIYRGQQFNFEAYGKYITVVPLSDTLDKIKAAPKKALEVVTEAVTVQMAATNALIVDLRKRYESALVPVLSIENAFHFKIQTNAAKFYGPYHLQEE